MDYHNQEKAWLSQNCSESSSFRLRGFSLAQHSLVSAVEKGQQRKIQPIKPWAILLYDFFFPAGQTRAIHNCPTKLNIQIIQRIRLIKQAWKLQPDEVFHYYLENTVRNHNLFNIVILWEFIFLLSIKHHQT